MRILADENFPGDVVSLLLEKGHDVLWARRDMPGAADSELLDLAQREERFVVTFDKDFGDLAFYRALPANAGVILFRLRSPSSDRLKHSILKALESRSDWSGHFSVVEDGRIRMTKMNIDR